MKISRKYGTHRAALRAACARSTGPIIEVGAGVYSTPMLLEIARAELRPLVTVEHVDEWRPRAVPGHVVTDSLESGLAAFEHFGVALVDGPAAERAVALLALLPKCDHIVVHDTELVGDYPGLEAALAQCRYRYDFTDRMPWTSVVSDLVRWKR